MSPPNSLPLNGRRILEIGAGRAVPFAARILADLGAEVIKIESPDGDPTRRIEPTYVTDDQQERGALFEYLNWNKLGVSIDPNHGEQALHRLIETSDLLMIGDDIALLDEWGIRPDALRAKYPDLVVLTITPFGTSGPKSRWVVSDLVLQASSGLMSFGGYAEREPLKRGLFQSTYEVGLTAAYVSQAALFAGSGAFLDISMAECITSELVLTVAEYAFTGAISARRPKVLDPLSSGDPLPAGDGYVAVQVNTQIAPSAYAPLVGDERLADERFSTQEGRATHAAELEGIFRAALEGDDPRGFFVRASSEGLLAGFVQTAAQLLTCPHLSERDLYVAMPGTLSGRPWKMPAVLSGITHVTDGVRPAPGLGEHNHVVLDEETVLV